jgi:hypothetical protein
MNNKIELANPIDMKEIKTGFIISLVVVIIYIIYEFIVNGLAWIDFFISILIILLLFFIWTSRQVTIKPKSIEIEGDLLILHYRFKSKPLKMKLEDIESLTVSLDGSKTVGRIGFDATLIFKVKTPVYWFPIYWKSAIILREQYKSIFGVYPPMNETYVKNLATKMQPS